MDLKALKEKLAALLAEIEQAEADSNDEKKDEAAKTVARELYKAKSLEYETLEKRVEDAKKIAAKRATLVEVGTLAEVVPGNVIPHGKVHATAADHDKEEAEKVNLFTGWICGERLSDSALSAMGAKSTGWKSGSVGIALPKSLAEALLPERRVMGKSLPLTSLQASPANLYQADFSKSLQMYGSEGGQLFERTFKVPTTSGKVIFPMLRQGAPGAVGGAEEFASTGYVATGWTSEGAQKPGTEPIFDQKDILTHELSARTELSRLLLNRSTINLEQLLQTLFRASILQSIDNAIIGGDGNGKPFGVLNTAGIGAPARATGGAVKYADIIKMEHAIAPQFRKGAAYVIADTALEAIKLLVDLQGRPLFKPLTSSAGEVANMGTINGYPIIPTELTTLGAAGDVMFANWSQYLAPVEQEIVMLRSEHEKMSQGVITFVVLVQVGGKPMQLRAFAKLPA